MWLAPLLFARSRRIRLDRKRKRSPCPPHRRHRFQAAEVEPNPRPRRPLHAGHGPYGQIACQATTLPRKMMTTKTASEFMSAPAPFLPRRH
ncbi:MAG TPA: hypothetical protein VMR14_20070 [Streptosporangiaceae bacterium]|nr:hypothetical protein [Streptosporangiaceae bacterium]